MALKTDYQEVMIRMKMDVDYIAEEAYKDGVKDGRSEAWEAAKKLFSTMAESDIEKAFPIEWNSGGFNALINLQPQEAIAKLKAYEAAETASTTTKRSRRQMTRSR